MNQQADIYWGNDNQSRNDSHIPKINSKSTMLPRSISDLYKWNDIRNTKQQMMRKYLDMVQDNRIKPFVYTNEISNEILRYTRTSNQPIEQLLLQKGQEREERLKAKEFEMYGQENIPKITNRGHNIQRDQKVHERLYGLGSKTPNRDTATKSQSQKNLYNYQSEPLTVIPSKKTLLSPRGSASKSVPMGLKMLEKFKAAYIQDHNSASDLISKQQPFTSKQKEQPLSEKIRSFMNPSNHYSQQSIVKPTAKLNETPIQNLPTEEQQSIQKNKVKECYFSLIPIQKQLGRESQGKTQSAQGKLQKGQRYSAKSTDAQRKTTRDKENIYPNSQKQIVDTKSFILAERQPTNGQNRMTKVYKYILEKE